MDEEAAAFGALLQSFRKDSSFSQNGLAGAVGKSQGWLAKIETGRSPPPDRGMCERLAAAICRGDKARADALGARLFAVGAPARLRLLHPDLWEWHLAEAVLRRSQNEEIGDSWDQVREMVAPHDGLVPADHTVGAAMGSLAYALVDAELQGALSPLSALAMLLRRIATARSPDEVTFALARLTVHLASREPSATATGRASHNERPTEATNE